MKPIKVGVVGLSVNKGWAPLSHVPAIKKLPEFELAALSNRTDETANEASKAFEVPEAYVDNQQLVDSQNVDLVSVTVRVPLHKEVVELALNGGKHVYSEWPLGKTLEETEELAKLAKRKNLKGFIGLQSRNMPEFAYLKDLVKNNELGEIQSTTLIGSGIFYGAEMPEWTAYAVDANNGIGMIFSTFGNAIDALSWVLGEFTELNATAVTRRKTITVSETRKQIPMTVYDQVAVNGVLQSGAVASAHYRGGTLKSNNFMWEINGSKGYVLVTGDGGNPAAMGVKVQIAKSMDDPLTDAIIPERYFRPELIGLPQPAVNVGHNYALIAKDINEGTSLAPTFEDAVRRHRMIHAIEVAASTGVRQYINPSNSILQNLNSDAMKAVILKGTGGVENLVVTELPVPAPGPDEILIQVKAISINPAETYLRKDGTNHWIFGNDSPIILGWDVSGVVTALGNEVSGFTVGDEVFGVIRHPGHGKAYAEYAVAPAGHMAHKPINVSHEQAAAATLAALTALQPMQKVSIRPGQKVLVIGAGGGVGHFAVQLAKYFGAYVIALASAPKKEFVLGLGADEFIDYQAQRFEQVVNNVDLVIEAVKVDGHVLRSLEVLKPGGNLISLWSHITEEEAFKAQRLKVNAFYNMVISSGKDMKFVASLLESKAVVPHVSKVFPLEDIAQAHLEIETNHSKGKIIVVP